MTLGSFVLSLLTLWLDGALTDEKDGHFAIKFLVVNSPEGARQVLSTIAGSMITVTGVVFSITIVSLTLASQQFGPRILRTFMSDRGNQFTLGTFTATYLYSLLVQRAISGLEDGEFVPHISVAVGVGLAVLSLAVLIYFIHHIAVSIQAAHVVSVIGKDLIRTANRLYPERFGGGTQAPPEFVFPEDFDRLAAPIMPEQSGYVRWIDDTDLMRIAQEHDLIVRIKRRPGKFADKAVLAQAYPLARVTEKVAEELGECFMIGSMRTQAQDVEFTINQLAEVASRALSPGINDPYTAMQCIDRLIAGLVHLSQRRFPSPFRTDDTNTVRVIAELTPWEELLRSGLDPIRQYGGGHVMVARHLLKAAGRMIPLLEDPAHVAETRRFADDVLATFRSKAGDDPLLREVEASHRLTQSMEPGRHGSEGPPPESPR